MGCYKKGYDKVLNKMIPLFVEGKHTSHRESSRVSEQQVMNKKVNDFVVLDTGKGDKIIGIEIIDASKHLKLDDLLPVKYVKAS